MNLLERANRHELLLNRIGIKNKSYQHAVSTLHKQGLIEVYTLYTIPAPLPTTPIPQDKQPITVAIIKVGRKLDGPVGKVHGGIVALLFDDVFGYGSIAALPYPALTKDLAVQYKKPQPHDTHVVVRVYVDHEKTAAAANRDEHSQQASAHRKRRRIFLKATCKSLGSSSTPQSAPFDNEEADDGILFSTATCTFVQVHSGPLSADRSRL